MKHEMRPAQPDITLRHCRDKREIVRAVCVAASFIEDYDGLPNSECIYGMHDGASYYAKCTRGGNVVVERV